MRIYIVPDTVLVLNKCKLLSSASGDGYKNLKLQSFSTLISQASPISWGLYFEEILSYFKDPQKAYRQSFKLTQD